jgi:hypothetical protein
MLSTDKHAIGNAGNDAELQAGLPGSMSSGASSHGGLHIQERDRAAIPPP